MSRVLVTGGAGFIGSHLVDALLEQKHRITVVDDLSSGRRENLPDGVELIREDIRSSRMKDIWRDVRPEYVYHLAAQKNVRTSMNNPLLDADINITGSLNIIEQSRLFKVKKFIFASTGGIYGEQSRVPSPESSFPKPESPYSIAKYSIEQYLHYFAKNRGLNSVSLRFANVYGPRQDPKGEAGVVAIFAQSILSGQSLQIFGDGRQTRDYIFVADVVEALLQAMKLSKATEVVNIGTAKQTSVNDLAKKLAKAARFKLKTKHSASNAGEIRKNALQNHRAKKVLRWKPVISLDDGLMRTWEWAQQSL